MSADRGDYDPTRDYPPDKVWLGACAVDGCDWAGVGTKAELEAAWMNHLADNVAHGDSKQ
jgi:hypothetical protein